MGYCLVYFPLTFKRGPAICHLPLKQQEDTSSWTCFRSAIKVMVSLLGRAQCLVFNLAPMQQFGVKLAC